MRAVIVAAGAALVLCHGPARAQDAAQSGDIRALVDGRGYPEPGQMRSAGMAGNTDAWLTPADIPDAIRTAAHGQSAGSNYQIGLAQVAYVPARFE